jgi:prepilin-type N-terminal cleavage/methylation domain-containing protein
MRAMSQRASNMNLPATNARGFSLVELMVALAAGLIVSAAVVAFLMSSFRSNADYVVSTRLTQELRNTLDLVSRDLRRSGYDEYSVSGMATGRISPFSHVRLCDAAGACVGDATAPTPPLTCVIYSYDRNGSHPGALDVDNGEVRALRRKLVTAANGLTNVGVIEYAVSTGTTKPTCTGAGPDYTTFPVTCNTTTTWCALTDPTKMDITSFVLTDSGANTGGVKLRDIGIDMQGRPAGTNQYIRGVHTSVRIRSDCFDTSLASCSLSP